MVTLILEIIVPSEWGRLYIPRKMGGVTIDMHTHIAAQCYIIDMDHGIQAGTLIDNQKNSVQPIVIGNDVWIGAGAKILKGSIIHNHSVIGANAVVKGEVLENSVVVGIPAKTVKFRK